MRSLLHSLGQRVRQLRLESGFSIRELASRSDLSERYLSELEAGRGNISVARLASLAAALGKSASGLLQEAEAHLAGDQQRVIALLGLRGAGKSTIGGRLASRLGLPFFELDGLVELAAGLSIGEIFDLHGEESYRRLEVEVLQDFLQKHPRAVLATGGGIVTHPESYALLRAHTCTVWLRADPDDHWNRVIAQGDVRPMAGNPSARVELGRILREREALYAAADYCIDTSRLGLAGSVETLATKLAEEAAAVSSHRST